MNDLNPCCTPAPACDRYPSPPGAGWWRKYGPEYDRAAFEPCANTWGRMMANVDGDTARLLVGAPLGWVACS